MLTIRNQQMEAFRQASMDGLADQLARHLLHKYPARSAAMGGESGVRAFIRRNLHKPVQWGIESLGAIATVFELLLQFGEAFERSPAREWSINILSHPVMAGDLKVDTVWQRHQTLTEGRPVVQV